MCPSYWIFLRYALNLETSSEKPAIIAAGPISVWRHIRMGKYPTMTHIVRKAYVENGKPKSMRFPIDLRITCFPRNRGILSYFGIIPPIRSALKTPVTLPLKPKKLQDYEEHWRNYEEKSFRNGKEETGDIFANWAIPGHMV